MTIRVNNIGLSLDDDISLIKKKLAKKLRLKEDKLPKYKIIKESLDARKKNNIKLNYAVELDLNNEEALVEKLKDNDVRIDKSRYETDFELGKEKLSNRPVVVGMGPAGLFAALFLAKKGYKPLVIERGEDVDNRTITVEKFWEKGILNENSNVQFGEGGAGTFSDGKLTTRIKDRRCDFILESLVEHGAPEDIIYKGKPHVGTDILKNVVKNIREEIKSLGGEVSFNSKLEDIKTEDGKLKAIVVNGEEIPCDDLILAIGHSSRDTYEMLYKNSVMMIPKAFAMGVRIEHLQSMINENQYGEACSHPRLKAAEYMLTYQDKEKNRGIYSFCMCPGGVVVGAASENGRLCVNGMSYHARDKENANAAMVVTVSPEDFGLEHPLAGMYFQRKYEELAYNLTGGNYKLPVQLVGDFLEDRVSTKLGRVTPSVAPNYVFSDLRKCLPDFVIESLKEGLKSFDKKIKGYGAKDAVMTGIETRTSAPVTMKRTENLESETLEGLYPAGEGAGFAGGIISAAVDGIKVAEKIMMKYAPVE
ncbi:MAG: NAD(P)/FAD-dependent oxidoreductase [Sarcina sp.]